MLNGFDRLAFKLLDALEELFEADRDGKIVDGVVEADAPTAAEATPAFERIEEAVLLVPVLVELTTRLANAFVRAPVDEPAVDVE